MTFGFGPAPTVAEGQSSFEIKELSQNCMLDFGGRGGFLGGGKVVVVLTELKI